jgi:hypothetical protein
MARTPRLFAGQLTPGDFRARISKPGQDASDPDLPRDQLDFDTAWPFAGNIHKVCKLRSYPRNVSQETVIDNPTRLDFPELPYVPVVKCFLSGPDGSWCYWRHEQSNYSTGTISWEVRKDHVLFYSQGPIRQGAWLVAVVFKIPARDIGIVGGAPHPLARMMMGRRGSEYGLYASRPGFDVRTCEKDQMTFSSDDKFTTENNTITGSVEGRADSPTDNFFTPIDFTYEWKGYYPIILFFCTLNLTGTNQTYILPSDKQINTMGGAYPAWGTINHLSPGVGQVQMWRLKKGYRIYWSIIVLDEPVPTD